MAIRFLGPHLLPLMRNSILQHYQAHGIPGFNFIRRVPAQNPNPAPDGPSL